jgi:hypothetical protein
LRGQKIEIAAPCLGAAADELDVRVREGDDPRGVQVFVQRVLLDVVESNFSAKPAVAEFEQVVFAAAGNRKRFLSEADKRRERGTALRLQSQKNASGLQNRCFPLPIPADKKIEPRKEFDPERFETAKISQLQVSEHLMIKRCSRLAMSRRNLGTAT